ncbi:hypothetical protein BGX21_002344 [Mortierella sp. AD011]|nr:hypothetical protein BGX21_002344 [Mortierella sp. AD011]
MVADWNLVNFLISGQSEEVFLTELGRLECVKIVGRDVRGFAHALRLFYSVRQNLVIAKNEAEEILNRDVLKGFEHRVIQNEIQASFMDVLYKGSLRPTSLFEEWDISKAESYDRYIYWTRRALSSTESGIQAKGLKMKEYWNAPGMERSLNKWWRDREDNHNQVEKTQAFAFAI